MTRIVAVVNQEDNELRFGRGAITGYIVIPEDGEIFFPHGEGFRVFLAGDNTRVELEDGTVLWHARDLPRSR